MNHPSREEWVSFLYSEMPPEQAADLEAHRAVCPECKSFLDSWQSTRQALDQWSIAAPAPANRRWFPSLRWAAAAAAVITFSFSLGRWTGPRPVDSETLKAQITASLEPALRQRLREDVSADVRGALETTWTAWQAARDQDRQTFTALVAEADQDRRIEDARLRNDLETLALSAYDRLERTRVQLGQLATYTLTSTDSIEPSNRTSIPKGN